MLWGEAGIRDQPENGAVWPALAVEAMVWMLTASPPPNQPAGQEPACESGLLVYRMQIGRCQR